MADRVTLPHQRLQLLRSDEEDSLTRIIELMFGWRQWVRRIGRSKYRFMKVVGQGRITHRPRTKGYHKIVIDGDG
jgi:hypothetical protein